MRKAINQPTTAVPAAKAPVERLALRVEEAGEALGIGRDLVFRLIREQKLRAVKCGGRTLIPVAAIKDYLSAG